MRFTVTTLPDGLFAVTDHSGEIVTDQGKPEYIGYNAVHAWSIARELERCCALQDQWDREND